MVSLHPYIANTVTILVLANMFNQLFFNIYGIASIITVYLLLKWIEYKQIDIATSLATFIRKSIEPKALIELGKIGLKLADAVSLTMGTVDYRAVEKKDGNSYTLEYTTTQGKKHSLVLEYDMRNRNKYVAINEDGTEVQLSHPVGVKFYATPKMLDVSKIEIRSISGNIVDTITDNE